MARKISDQLKEDKEQKKLPPPPTPDVEEEVEDWENEGGTFDLVK